MKIIHGIDYYDNANCGIDETIIFVRNGKTTKPVVDYPFRKISITREHMIDHRHPSYQYNFAAGWVFCAGEVYPVIRRAYWKDYNWKWDETIDTTEWTKYSFDNFPLDYYYNVDDALAGLEESKFGKSHKWFTGSNNMQKITEHFTTRNPKWTEWLIGHGIITGCIFVNSRRIIQQEYNTACLGAMNFYSMVDPFTTNQNIAGYIGGVLVPSGNPMIALKDKDKIKKAGFDYKSSFRKAPIKRK